MNGNCLPSPREKSIISRDLRQLRAGGQRLPTKWLNTARLQSQHSWQSTREDLLRHFKFGNRYTDPLLLHTAQPVFFCCFFAWWMNKANVFFASRGCGNHSARGFHHQWETWEELVTLQCCRPCAFYLVLLFTTTYSCRVFFVFFSL